jgi:hypothetical protein
MCIHKTPRQRRLRTSLRKKLQAAQKVSGFSWLVPPNLKSRIPDPQMPLLAFPGLRPLSITRTSAKPRQENGWKNIATFPQIVKKLIDLDAGNLRRFEMETGCS